MQGYRIYPAYPTYQQVQYTIAIEDDAKKDAYSYQIFETKTHRSVLVVQSFLNVFLEIDR